ncbi:MAG: DUF4315 family protein [Ethanoligenens sp.]
MIPKISKIDAELNKTRKKISELQAYVRELEQQKTELENTDIVGLVRTAGMTPQELAVLIRACRENSGAPHSIQTVQEENNHE